MDIMLLNVRVPEERQGDHNAQIASCKLGARRFAEVAETHGLANVLVAFDEIISRTATRMRAAISEIPDGIYTFDDFMDADGINTYDIPICLKLTVKGDRIHLDFAGTSPQVKGNINTTMNAVQASVNYALIAALDSDMPSNQGVLDVVDIECEKGTLLNCVFPAPVAARAHACQRVIDVVLGALSNAVPHNVIAAANGANTTAVFSGVDPRTDKPYPLLRDAGRRDGRAGDQRRQRRRAGWNHQYIEPASGIDRAGIPAAGRGIWLRRKFGRRGQVSWRHGAAQGFDSGRS